MPLFLYSINITFFYYIVGFFTHFVNLTRFRTPFKKNPKINGKDIDLYLLYVVVTAHGGWIKVSPY